RLLMLCCPPARRARAWRGRRPPVGGRARRWPAKHKSKTSRAGPQGVYREPKPWDMHLPQKTPDRRKTEAWVGSLDLVMLLTLLGILGGVWVFIAVAYGVRTGSAQQLDERLLRALRNPPDLKEPLGPPWLAEVGRDLTALGGVAALCLVTA